MRVLLCPAVAPVVAEEPGARRNVLRIAVEQPFARCDLLSAKSAPLQHLQRLRIQILGSTGSMAQRRRGEHPNEASDKHPAQLRWRAHRRILTVQNRISRRAWVTGGIAVKTALRGASCNFSAGCSRGPEARSYWVYAIHSAMDEPA